MPPITPDNQFIFTQSFSEKQNDHYEHNRNFMCLNLVLFISKKSWIKNTFSIFLTGVILLAAAYFSYGMMLMKDKVNSVVNLVEHVSYFIFILACLIPIFCLSRYKVLHESIFTITEKSLVKNNMKNNFGKYVTIFILVGISAIVLDITFFLSTFGWSIYQYFIVGDIQFFFFNVLLLTTLELADWIKELYMGLNEALSSVANNYFIRPHDGVPILASPTDNFGHGEVKAKLLYPYKTAKCLELLRYLTEYHNQVCDLLDKFNKMFGLVLLVFIVSIMANILLAITIFIEYAVRHVTLGGVDVSKWILATNTTWILALIGQIILLAEVGAGVCKEGRNTGVRCHGLLNKLHFHEENKDEIFIKYELILLAKQAETRKPELSAGGFFSINLGVLSLVAKNVTSYSIVIIQFLLKDK